MIRVLVVALLLMPFSQTYPQSVFAEYQFDTEKQEKDFKQLAAQLRCLVCQNQNIADSNAPLAQDLRREIHTMLNNGDSKQDVIDFMVQRYGEFVLYKPMISLKTIALWFGPVLFFLLGLFVLWRLSNKPASAVADPDRQALAQARRLLDDGNLDKHSDQ